MRNLWEMNFQIRRWRFGKDLSFVLIESCSNHYVIKTKPSPGLHHPRDQASKSLHNAFPLISGSMDGKASRKSLFAKGLREGYPPIRRLISGSVDGSRKPLFPR